MSTIGKILRFTYLFLMSVFFYYFIKFVSSLKMDTGYMILIISIGAFIFVPVMITIFLKFIDPIGKQKELTYEDLTGIPKTDDESHDIESEKARIIRESQVVEERIKLKKEVMKRENN